MSERLKHKKRQDVIRPLQSLQRWKAISNGMR